MFSAIFIVLLHTPNSKKVVALFDWRLVHGVWPFTTPGAYLVAVCATAVVKYG